MVVRVKAETAFAHIRAERMAGADITDVVMRLCYFPRGSERISGGYRPRVKAFNPWSGSYVTLTETAQKLRLPVSKVSMLIKEGKIPFFRMSCKKYISRSVALTLEKIVVNGRFDEFAASKGKDVDLSRLPNRDLTAGIEYDRIRKLLEPRRGKSESSARQTPPPSGEGNLPSGKPVTGPSSPVSAQWGDAP